MDIRLKLQARAPWYEDNFRCTTNGTTAFFRTTEWDVLYQLFHSSFIGKNQNWGCYSDPQTDRMLEQARAEVKVDKRRQLYVEIQKRLLDQAAVVPLFEDYAVWAMRPNVKGFKLSGFTFPILGDVYID